MLGYIIGILIFGIPIGLTIWISVKLVAPENRENNLIGNLIVGCIISGVLYLPIFGGFLAILILGLLYRHYDLSLGEIFFVFIAVVIVYLVTILVFRKLVTSLSESRALMFWETPKIFRSGFYNRLYSLFFAGNQYADGGV